MSEKVGSGDNDSQLLEQEQILLDWQDLPSYDLVKKPIEGEAENSQDAQDEKTKKDERLTAQVRGERLLRAVAESTPEERVAERVETEKDEATTADDEKSGVDTVMMRADQALGRERFVDLTDYLLELSYIEEPDEVMQEFRDEAEKVATIGAGDLWEAILHAAKLKRFAERLGDVKFYYSTNFADFAKILESGKLVRTDDEGSALKSDLKFSYDHMEDGEWKSGFADERGAKADDVTMMFDMSLLLEDSFVALGKNPSASEVDIKKSCLGVVVDGEDYMQTRRLMSFARCRWMPMYLDGGGNTDWRGTAYSAAAFREMQSDYIERMKRAQELAEMVYEGGADKLIEAQVEKFGEQVRESDLVSFYDKYHGDLDDEKREQMIADLARYYRGIFGIPGPVEVQHENDKNDPYTAVCGQRGDLLSVTINDAHVGDMELKDAVYILGHEMCHVHQDVRSEVHKGRLAGRTPEQERYDELCYYGNLNYIDATVDVFAYKAQFVEREAYKFSDLLQEKYAQVEAEMNKPVERAKRVAKKMGGKIMKVGKRGAKNRG